MNQNIITATKQNHKKWPSDTNQLVESYKFTSPETFTETNRLQNPFYAGSSKTENLGHDLSILSSWFFSPNCKSFLLPNTILEDPFSWHFLLKDKNPLAIVEDAYNSLHVALKLKTTIWTRNNHCCWPLIPLKFVDLSYFNVFYHGLNNNFCLDPKYVIWWQFNP